MVNEGGRGLESNKPYVGKGLEGYRVVKGDKKQEFSQQLKAADNVLFKKIYQTFGETFADTLDIVSVETDDKTYFVSRGQLSKAYETFGSPVTEDDIRGDQSSTYPGVKAYQDFKDKALPANAKNYMQLGDVERPSNFSDNAALLIGHYKSTKPEGANQVGFAEVNTLLEKSDAKFGVSVQKGDISNLEQLEGYESKDIAIVNAANETLQGFGTSGTNKSLFESSKSMWRATKNVLKSKFNFKQLKPGQAVRTIRNDGSHVIHALGPKPLLRSLGKQASEAASSLLSNEDKYDQVYQATYNALTLANENSVKLVLMPEISTGAFSGGKKWNEEANKAQLQAIADFREKHQGSSIEEIRLVAYEKHSNEESQGINLLEKLKSASAEDRLSTLENLEDKERSALSKAVSKLSDQSLEDFLNLDGAEWKTKLYLKLDPGRKTQIKLGDALAADLTSCSVEERKKIISKLGDAHQTNINDLLTEYVLKNDEHFQKFCDQLCAGLDFSEDKLVSTNCSEQVVHEEFNNYGLDASDVRYGEGSVDLTQPDGSVKSYKLVESFVHQGESYKVPEGFKVIYDEGDKKVYSVNRVYGEDINLGSIFSADNDNHDASVALPGEGYFVIADGSGAGPYPTKAAQEIVRAASEYYLQHRKPEMSLEEDFNLQMHSMRHAQNSISGFPVGSQNDSQATFLSASLRGDQLTGFSVGDTAGYVLHWDEETGWSCKPIFNEDDDREVQYTGGHLAAEKKDEYGTKISTPAIVNGLEPFSVKVEPGDIVILSSDGLPDGLSASAKSSKEIATLLNKQDNARDLLASGVNDLLKGELKGRCEKYNLRKIAGTEASKDFKPDNCHMTLITVP